MTPGTVIVSILLLGVVVLAIRSIIRQKKAVKACGGDIEETEDGLVIRGGKPLTGGKALGCNDHRIVMSMATAAVGSTKEIFVTDPMSINKSYPDFFEDYNSLGGKADVIDLG